MISPIIKTASFAVLILFFCINNVIAQGLEEHPLSFNPALKGRGVTIKKIGLRSSSIADTISLGVRGIFEDFSYKGAYPDTAIWLDSMVYINRGFGISPPTIGVATFDGLGADGFPYNFFSASTAAAPADTLTSKPIDLTYPEVDSIYLSFYYQAQGLGNDPQTDDSLVLEFKGPDTAAWSHIWSQSGYALLTNDSAWHLVMIPIRSASFLKKGFQFRFRNYASINANADQWNIDNVYLNRIRTINDTVQVDVTWVYDGNSLLEKYRAMPWNQYTQSELTTNIDVLIRNNDSVLQNIGYQYSIDNVTTSSNIDVYSGSSNIYPFSKNKIYTDCDVVLGCISTAAINTGNFPATLTSPTKLEIQHYFTGLPGDISVRNDTLKVINDFSNYFAYDDGEAESEVGLVNALDGQLALKFTLNTPDTLYCLDIYFDPFITNAELYAFYLNVWDDNGGFPGTVVYSNTNSSSPVYQKTGMNAFTRYYLETPQFLSAGTYYVGFTQKTTESLNVGLDKNNKASNTLFYNVGSGWVSSPFSGAIMMHPVMGYVPYVGIGAHPRSEDDLFHLYPNPVNDKLHIQMNAETNRGAYTYQISDMFGKRIAEYKLNTSEAVIDVANLSSGVYLIKIFNATFASTQKFVKIN